MKDKFSGLKKFGQVEVLLIAFGYRWEENHDVAKTELLKLGFTEEVFLGYQVPGIPVTSFCRKCDRKSPLDLEALGQILLGLEYEQVEVTGV